MKKKLLTLAVALLAATGAWAQTTFTADNLKYTVTDAEAKTVELTGYVTKPTGTLTIPATVTNESTEYSVTSIGSWAFSNCSSLTAVTIPEGVATIGHSAFEGCSSLTAVNIPEGVTSIGGNAFRNCSSLTAVTLPDGLTTIGNSAFFNCTSLTGITLPDGLTTIGDTAFSNCTSLTGITIPNTVTSIGSSAFRSCSSLATVTIGSSVTSIGSSAFYGCTALAEINVDGSNTAYSSANGVLFDKAQTALICYPAGKPQLEYTIPSSVTVIGKNAFSYCAALTTLTIPASVTSIGEWAFDGCTALAEMTVLATIPPELSSNNSFEGVSREIPVYVPAASLAAYKEAEGWKEFTNLQAINTSGLPAAVMPESIRMQGGLLHNPQGLHLTLYDMQGRQVYSGTAATLSQPAGVYVVRCAGASGKVLF